ncbi:MAG TPA: hypothetical protein VE360_08515, partial [Pyrinomonadaceae bacterium]|nr:hypothetical protein [Pyrinomonadaceae bacterium]
IVALLAVPALLGVLQHHATFDPYSWAVPGVETVESRDLWLARRDLYIYAGLCALVASAILLIAAYVGKRRAKLS